MSGREELNSVLSSIVQLNRLWQIGRRGEIGDCASYGTLGCIQVLAILGETTVPQAI